MPETKKVVVKVEVHNDKQKRKALKKVSSLSGIDSLAMDMKDKKLTVIGDVDPVHIVEKLKKCCHTQILTVGPAKEDKKNEKKDDKKDDKKKEEDDPCKKYAGACRAYCPCMIPQYCVYSVEENPNSCVIF